MSVAPIPINRTGRILSADQHEGWLIRVEPFPENPSAYYVLYFTADHAQGFDDWVQDYESLCALFEGRRLAVAWDTSPHAAP